MVEIQHCFPGLNGLNLQTVTVLLNVKEQRCLKGFWLWWHCTISVKMWYSICCCCSILLYIIFWATLLTKWTLFGFLDYLSTPLLSDVSYGVIHHSLLWLDPLLRTCWKSCWWKIHTGGWVLDHEGLKTSKHTPSSRSSLPQLPVTRSIALGLCLLLIHPRFFPFVFVFFFLSFPITGPELGWSSREESAKSF